jgi:recombination protein RecR
MAPALPDSVRRLIDEFAALPGIGRRSAERLAFWVLKSPTEEAMRLADAISTVKRTVRHCAICWNLTDDAACPICTSAERDAASVLVVEQPKDLITLETTGMYKGVYHVLLGRLDPLDGVGPDSLTVSSLLERLERPEKNARGVKVTELILGLNPDMEGDSTALWLADQARKRGVSVSRLARGLPTGSQIEYANSAVLADAIAGRQKL